MIHSKDISIVVQGVLDSRNTLPALKSMRKHFPGAEIILSTWEGSDVENLTYDKVIFNKDPVAICDASTTNLTNNLSRRLVSTQAGIRASGRKYIIKTRPDICFTSNQILGVLNQFPVRNPYYSIFDSRIVVCSYFTKKYLMSDTEVQPTPFHLSDWISFGLRSDIEKLYAAPLPKEPEQSSYFIMHPYSGTKKNLLGAAYQYVPEQYMLYSAVRQVLPDVEFKHYMDFTHDNIHCSAQIIANNFIVFPPKDLGIICLKNSVGKEKYHKWCKRPTSLPYTIWKGLYRLDVFVSEYRKYCDDTYTLPFLKRVQLFGEMIFKELLK